MYVIPKLRLNVFADVRIPSNKDLYVQFGMRNVVRPGSVGADGSFAEPVNLVGNKLSDLSRGESEFNQMYSAYVESEARKNEPASDDKPDDAAKQNNIDVHDQSAS